MYLSSISRSIQADITFGTVLVIIKLTKFAVALRLRCGSCKKKFDIILPCFAKFKTVVHSLETGDAK